MKETHLEHFVIKDEDGLIYHVEMPDEPVKLQTAVLVDNQEEVKKRIYDADPSRNTGVDTYFKAGEIYALECSVERKTTYDSCNNQLCKDGFVKAFQTLQFCDVCKGTGGINPKIAAHVTFSQPVEERDPSIKVMGQGFHRDVFLPASKPKKSLAEKMNAISEKLKPVEEKNELPEVIRFLLGESSLDGHWFGDSFAKGGKFWWRSDLRKLFLKDKSEPIEEQKETQEKGMDELTIYRFQAKTIENALRLAMNVLESRNKAKETAMDRELLRADDFIKKVLTRTHDR